jgi:hypothetical protein
MTKLHRDATLTIAPVDLCDILGELICKDYTLFQSMTVASIEQSRDGNFQLELVPKPKPKLASIKPGSQTVSDMVKS